MSVKQYRSHTSYTGNMASCLRLLWVKTLCVPKVCVVWGRYSVRDVRYTSDNWELCKKQEIRTSTKRTSEQSEGLSSVPWSHTRQWILSKNDRTPQWLHSSILKVMPRPVTRVPQTIMNEISDSPKLPRIRKYSSTGLCISRFPGMTTAVSELAELYLLLQKFHVCNNVNWAVSTRPMWILPNQATTPCPWNQLGQSIFTQNYQTSQCFHRTPSPWQNTKQTPNTIKPLLLGPKYTSCLNWKNKKKRKKKSEIHFPVLLSWLSWEKVHVWGATLTYIQRTIVTLHNTHIHTFKK